MTKILYLIRHAHAEDAGNSAMIRDFERDLTSRGIMQSARIGKHLFDKQIKIDSIFCSPANRTVQTAKIVCEQLKFDLDAIKVDTNLYGGGPRAYLACVNSLSDSQSAVAIVGHNPDISFFAEYLTRDDVQGSMKKATVIIFKFENSSWAEVSSKDAALIERIDVADLQQ